MQNADPHSTVSREELTDALKDVQDLHIPVSLLDLGMIYEYEFNDGVVEVEMTYPCMGCPAYDMMQGDVEDRLLKIPSVERVEIDVVWDPVWSKDMVTERGKQALQEAGVCL